MFNVKKLLALTLTAGMCFGSVASVFAEETIEAATEAVSEATEAAEKAANTLVYGEDAMDGKFSPFFYTAVPDEDVVRMLFPFLLEADREGAVILNGIEGETREYNGTDYTYYGIADCEIVENEDGTVDYNITMRDDLVWSDGEPMTIDDAIFSLYVYCDPTYDGNSTVFALPIEGMTEYRSGMESLFSLLTAAGEENTDFTYWDEATQTAFWADLNQAGEAFAQSIVDYVIAAGYNAEGDSVAACAANWGYTLDEGATAADFFKAMAEAYEGDYLAMSDTEKADATLQDLMEDYDAYSIGVETGESAPSITGIKKTGDYTMTITTTSVDATAIYQLTSLIAPLHYYGDKEAFDVDNNNFGFPKGDLSGVKSHTTQPLGAGPYTFESYENGVATVKANPLYYKGEPKIEYINFQFVQEADKASGVGAGTLDIASPSFSLDTIDEMTALNGGSEDFDGDVITIKTVANLGYGYIGINAKNVCVGGEPGSEASKNLRKGIATVLSVYRDVAMDSYYGEWANVINYPISDTSWAAPRVTDEGYKIAFSTDVNGNPIYTDDMTEDEKYAAALQAALGFFEAAGYTVEDGKLTAAPEGASLEYEIMIPGSGIGDHPNFMILTLAKDALATIGFNLIVTDLSDGTVTIGNNLDAGTAEMWTMAWQATADPDMYQIYYSDVANGGKNPGGSNKYYAIEDAELDELIMAARQSTDQAYRKIIYKECLDRIVDWATEIPVYQRQNCLIFSTERVNMDTVTPDITTYWLWYNDIEKMELN